MKPIKTISLIASLSILLAVTACNLNTGTASPGSVEFVYTSAAQTAQAQLQLTQVASSLTVQVTSTPSPTPAWTSTLTPAPTNTSNSVNPTAMGGCDSSAYLADVTFPDNTVVAPNTAFRKTWSLKNTGTCTWTTGYSIIFISGNQMGGATTNLTTTVAPGGTTQVSVNLVSPADNGTYKGTWRLMNASGVPFGGLVTVVIQVSSSVTSTPTLTTTAASTTTTGYTATTTSTTGYTATTTSTMGYTATPSSTFTFTPTATDTPLPTSTPTPDATATETATP